VGSRADDRLDSALFPVPLWWLEDDPTVFCARAAEIKQSDVESKKAAAVISTRKKSITL
jgi:hypothetical protein